MHRTFFIAFMVCFSLVSWGKTQDRQCLAVAIWKEARGETLKGQRAVKDVILTRAKQKKKSVCSIIKERNQFSWMRKGMPLRANNQQMALLIRLDSIPPVVLGYTHFAQSKVKRKWMRKAVAKKTIGRHTYYKIKEK